MPDHIILLLHSAVFALSNHSTEVKNESVGWQDVARNVRTPDDKNSALSRRRFFGITDGGQSPMEDHPVFMEMFAIPITGALCYSLNFC